MPHLRRHRAHGLAAPAPYSAATARRRPGGAILLLLAAAVTLLLAQTSVVAASMSVARALLQSCPPGLTLCQSSDALTSRCVDLQVRGSGGLCMWTRTEQVKEDLTTDGLQCTSCVMGLHR